MPGSTPTVLLDAGANADVQAEWLVQFAQMGSVYARHRFGMAAPKVGLLSIGEEAGKGDSLRKEAFQLLEAAPGIDFIGNVEGRDIMTDDVDVVVTDGFTGNVVLKALEGGVRIDRQGRCSSAIAADGVPRARRGADAGARPAATPRSTRTPTAAPCCSASTASASSPTARAGATAMLNGIKVADGDGPGRPRRRAAPSGAVGVDARPAVA